MIFIDKKGDLYSIYDNEKRVLDIEKTKDNKYYCMKFIDEDYEGIFSNLSLLDLNSFVIPYLNKYIITRIITH